MSTSFAESFRTLQAIQDLRVLVRSAPDAALVRIAAGRPALSGLESDALGRIRDLAEGPQEGDGPFHDVIEAVRLAAALPRQDFETFLAATMILFADALHRLEQVEDVDWYWQTFRSEYRAAGAAVRAAIVQAIRRIGAFHLVGAPLPETLSDRATATPAGLKPLLDRLRRRGAGPRREGDIGRTADTLLAALSDPDAVEEAEGLWSRFAPRYVAEGVPELLAGFRHIYETHDGWSPGTDVLIPLLDPPPGVAWPH